VADPEPDGAAGPTVEARCAAMRGRCVLVTGSQGFIGGHLVRRLVELDADVHAVSRRAEPTAKTATAWPVDLRDEGAVRRLVRELRPEIVFHLAGAVSGTRNLDFVLPSLATNLVGTVNLLTAATAHGLPRVVLAASMEEPNPGEPEATPSSPYAASKAAAGAYARMFHGLWGLPTVALRIAMGYGPAQPDPRKLIPYVVNCLLAGEPPQLTSGTRGIDWVYIDDVVDAFIAAAGATGVEGRTFEIGSGVSTDIRRTVELICEVMGAAVDAEYGAVEDRRLDSARISDIRGAAADLGWRPRVGLREGLRRTVDWHRRARRASDPVECAVAT
jgi:UDP-glucose 4-epimerase